MNWIFDLPLAVRLALLVLIGIALGSVINWAVYRFAFFRQRAISPWSPPAKNAPPRVATDRIPIYGWLGLRRETAIHGRGFWIRPLLIEFGFGVALAVLYWWDVVSGAYLENPVRVRTLAAGLPIVPDLVLAAHLRFLAHAILLFLMTVATFIDFDEKTIPSWVTDVGVLIGLVLAVVFPWSQLTHVARIGKDAPGLPAFGVAVDGLFADVVSLLTFASPNAPPTSTWSVGALLIGIACFWAWCFALLDRRWNLRLPLKRTVWLFFARVTYGPHFRRMAVIAVVGALAVFLVWRLGGIQWLGMFNALLGMTVGGGIVWTVRIIGRLALKREAMGFGDVTLMAMIGAFAGWQACLFIFFIAPFAGLVVGIAQFGFRLKEPIPYGPYLCLATLVVVLGWSRIWKAMYVYFQIPLLIPSVMGICAVMMLVVLWLMQIVKRRMGWAD